MRTAYFIPVVLLSVGCVKDDEATAPSPSGAKAERTVGPTSRDFRELTTAVHDMMAEQSRLKSTVRSLNSEVETLRVENRGLKAEVGKAKSEPAVKANPPAPALPPASSPPSVLAPVTVVECRPVYQVVPCPSVVVCPPPERRGLFGRRR